MKKGIVAFAAVALPAFYFWGAQMQFLAGGALIDLGYRMQDHLADYDFKHHEPTPAQVWEEFQSQNAMASRVRETFPRTARHPLVGLVACMDARLDTNEIAGDTRRYYYVLRLAGSALAAKDEEMLELAVANGVKLVVFSTHTDCAAEKTAADPVKSKLFPALTQAVNERQMRFNEFLARPLIQDHISKGELIVKWVDIDTLNERVMPHKQ